jgi:hypothetical protein
MARSCLAIAMAAAALASVQAPASDWKGSFATKRQMVTQVVDCMRKRMSSDRRISYNEAAKTCKDEVHRRFEDASSGPLVAADQPAK